MKKYLRLIVQLGQRQLKRLVIVVIIVIILMLKSDTYHGEPVPVPLLLDETGNKTNQHNRHNVDLLRAN